MCKINNFIKGPLISQRPQNSDIAFKPVFHGLSAFFRHRKGLLPFHFTLFVAEQAVPKFALDVTLPEIHFLGRRHDHIGFRPEAENAAGPGEDVIHSEGMQGW